MPVSPAETLKLNRERARKMAEQAGQVRTRKLLERAQADLVKRLQAAGGNGDVSKEPFSLAQMRVTLTQIKDVLRDLKKGMRSEMIDGGRAAAQSMAEGTLSYLDQMEARFTGINAPLDIDRARVIDRAVAGAESSILHRIEGDPTHKGNPGVLARYDANVIEKFEEELQLRYVSRKPWAEVRQSLIDASPFLQGAPASWAERIVRTESMNASGVASLATITSANDELGDMVKILSATFDDRTAADSYAVHGQIRRPREMFDTWFGQVMNPPARPNDREIVVPHRISWPLPPALAPKSAGEIASRWAYEGRKGSPPPQPNTSTVDRALFGKTPPPKIAPEQKPVVQAPIEEQPKPVEPQVPTAVSTQAQPEPKPKKVSSKALKMKAMEDALNKVEALPVELSFGDEYVKPPMKAQLVDTTAIKVFGNFEIEKSIAKLVQPKKKQVPFTSIQIADDDAHKESLLEEVANQFASKSSVPKLNKWGGNYLGWSNTVHAASIVNDTSMKAEVTDLDAGLKTAIKDAKAKYGKSGKFTKVDVMTPAPTYKDSFAAMVDWKKIETLDKTATDLKKINVSAIQSTGPVAWTSVEKILKGVAKDPKAFSEAPKVYEFEGKLYSASHMHSAKIAAQVALLGEQPDIAHQKTGEKIKMEPWVAVEVIKVPADFKKPPSAAYDGSKQPFFDPYKQPPAAPKLPVFPPGMVTKPLPPPAQNVSLPSVTLKTINSLPQSKSPMRDQSVLDRAAFNREAEANLFSKATSDERLAITRFTHGYDWLIRRVASGADREETIKMEMDHRSFSRAEAERRWDEATQFNKDIEASFKKLPATPMTTFRGIGKLSEEVFNQLAAQEVLEIDAPTSTSWDRDVARNFLQYGNRIMFHFHQKSGVPIEPISKYKSEAEILLPKGARFKISRTRLDDTTIVIEAEEI